MTPLQLLNDEELDMYEAVLQLVDRRVRLAEAEGIEIACPDADRVPDS